MCLNFVVTGLNSSVNNATVTTPSGDYAKYFDTLTGAPPPPVPPRSRSRRSSFSTTSSSISSHQGLKSGRLVSRKMEATEQRMNEGDSSSNSSPSSDSIQPQMQRMNPVVSSALTMQDQMWTEKHDIDDGGMMNSEQEKENINSNSQNDNSNHLEHDRNGKQSEADQKISVKERMQKFNRIASESELAVGLNAKASSRNRREFASKVRKV